jgi:hypothetical protein
MRGVAYRAHRLAGQECGGFFFVDVDPDVNAQLLGERRAGAGPRGRHNVPAISIGRRASPVAIRSTIVAASTGSQTLPLPMERNLAGARGPCQMRRYLIFCACATIPRYKRD